GTAAGLHLLAWLPPDVDEAWVISAAAERGILVYGLRPHQMRPDGTGALIFGYGSLAEPQIDEGVRALAPLIASARR
ncbi:MAG: PLP-dependent aminotransferase family protein, partial [Aldersonia sp.]|nr:PLP-dependent aminotransferase family protein [Aldersonia sp.]